MWCDICLVITGITVLIYVRMYICICIGTRYKNTGFRYPTLVVSMFLQVLSKEPTLLDPTVCMKLSWDCSASTTSPSSSCLPSCRPPLPPTLPRGRLVQRMFPEVGAPSESTSPTNRGQWWDDWVYTLFAIHYSWWKTVDCSMYEFLVS